MNTTMEGKQGQTLLPMQEIDRLLRESAVRREVVPMECRSGWLMPVKVRQGAGQSDRLYLKGFFYPAIGLAGQPKKVGRPRYQFTLDPSNGQIVSLNDCRVQDFAPQFADEEEIGKLTPDMLPAQTVPELEQFRAEMLSAYDDLLPFVFESPLKLTAAQSDAALRFRSLLKRAIEPFLMKYYRALSPQFFEWLEQF